MTVDARAGREEFPAAEGQSVTENGSAAERRPVLAIVPAHNEAGRVGEVVRALMAQGLPVLVVDDGSSDGSGPEAAAAGARVLRQEPNQGKGAALKAGFPRGLGRGRRLGRFLDPRRGRAARSREGP